MNPQTEDSEIESPAIVCSHVFTHERPILLAIHSADGIWQFLCGQDDHDDIEGAELVGLDHLVEHDSSLEAILELSPSHIAERDDISSDWLIEEFDESEEE